MLLGQVRLDPVAMGKRLVISGMWFVALWTLGGVIHLYLGIPRALMLVPTLICLVAIWVGLIRYDAWQVSRTPSRIGAIRHTTASPLREARVET